MSDWIEHDQYALPPGNTAGPPEARTAAPKTNPVLKLYGSARRHWVLVLAVWILFSVPACLWIWFTVKPTYTASADVEVAAMPVRILSDGERDPIGGFESYLNTQGEIIKRNSVLAEALADPSLKGLPLLATSDPVGALRAAITITSPPRTNLLRVGVRQPSADEAIRLCRALMKAYEAHAGGNRARAREQTQRLLNEAREKLMAEYRDQQNAIAEAGKKYKATSQEMFTAMRESVLKTSVQTGADLERARIEQLRLQSQLDQLNQNLLPTSMPAQEFLWKEQLIDSDPVIKRLRDEIGQEQWYLLHYGESAPHRRHLNSLEKQLKEQMERITAAADQRVQERSRAMLDDAKRRVREQLTAAAKLVGFLQNKYDAQQGEAQDMGRLALQIQQLQTNANATRDELSRVEDRLRELDIEVRKPVWISASLDPEILPDGISDRRDKLMKLSVVGSLGLGLLLALALDILSSRLYTMEDVEGPAGLNLLGALPALEDLRRGRVTEDDFRESYRAIRATLAGRSPGGKIPRAILVTSAQAAEGKTSLAVSLAASLAETGCRVLVVDGDVQAPRIARTLQLSLPYGLRHVLTGERPLAEAAGPTAIPNLDVLLSGRNGHSAGGILTADLAAGLVKAAAENYTHVIIDSPPVLGSADALIWARAVDGVVVASFAGRSSLRLVRHACQRIARAGGKILGSVLCNLSARENYCSYPSSTSRFASGGGHGHMDQDAASADEGPCVHMAGKMLPPSATGQKS
jgi:succinoglycan biosynthesis transport protein ExoP